MKVSAIVYYRVFDEGKWEATANKKWDVMTIGLMHLTSLGLVAVNPLAPRRNMHH